MASAPDLMSLLSLDPRSSLSAHGGSHRFILVEKDFTNSGDFVFNNLLQHFGRREPNSRILLVTLCHDWTNYSASAAKCGINLRKRQNMGNIDVLNVMDKFLEVALSDQIDSFDCCSYILQQLEQYIDETANESKPEDARPEASSAISPTAIRPLIVMIDDLSILLTLGANKSSVFKLVSQVDHILRTRSERLAGRHNYLVVQTMFTNVKSKQCQAPTDDDLNFLIANLENVCDLSVTLKPLETGHSTRVDGTIKIADHRLPAHHAKSADDSRATVKLSLAMFPSSTVDIGSKKSLFYKLGDRRVRLTTSALAL